MNIITTVTVGILTFALAANAFSGTPIAVTSCGQVVKGTGQLTADLNCSASADEAVKLNGKLLLNGFTLTGNPGFDVVRCEFGGCGVSGPGTVTGGADGVRSDHGAKIDAGAIITGNVGDGVRTDGAAKVSDSTISNNGGDGVRSKTKAKISGSTVSGNGSDGVRSDKTASVKESTITANAAAGVDSDASAKANASQVTANGHYGLKGLKVTLKASTATGNGGSTDCDIIDDCADVASEQAPKVDATSTCGTSRKTEGSGSWGVCSND